MKKKAAISVYIAAVLCVVGLLALQVYSSLNGGGSDTRASFTLNDIATLGLAVFAIPMWIAALCLMKALRLKGTLHERQNKMMISFPAVVCTGFSVFYIIVLVMMIFR